MLVVVALRAAHREPEKHGTDRRGHLAEQLVPGAVAARLGERRKPQKRQRDRALGVHPRQFARAHDLVELVAGDLLADEQVVRLVAVERVDDVVAVAPRVRHVGVALVARGVGVPRQVEPVARPPFTVARIVEQPIDEPFVGKRAAVVDEGIGDLRLRRHAEQVEVQPAHQRAALGQGCRLDAVGLQPGEDERVNRVADPVGVRHPRRRHRGNRRERPSLGLIRLARRTQQQRGGDGGNKSHRRSCFGGS